MFGSFVSPLCFDLFFIDALLQDPLRIVDVQFEFIDFLLEVLLVSCAKLESMLHLSHLILQHKDKRGI